MRLWGRSVTRLTRNFTEKRRITRSWHCSKFVSGKLQLLSTHLQLIPPCSADCLHATHCALYMQRNKTYPDFLHAYAYVQFRRGNYSAALEAIEKVVLSDASWDVMEHYGDILSRLNRSNEAVVQWRRAKEMGSTSKTLDQKIREAKWSE